jgi:hypothetical protein
LFPQGFTLAPSVKMCDEWGRWHSVCDLWSEDFQILCPSWKNPWQDMWA